MNPAAPATGLRGIYGTYGPLAVSVQTPHGATEFDVHMSYDFQIRRSQAMAAFAERIARKDKKGNDIVIVTCGVPDERGWANAGDHALYLHLMQVLMSGGSLLPRKPTHIRGVMVHQSQDTPGLILLSYGENLPWRESIATAASPRPLRRPSLPGLSRASPGANGNGPRYPAG